jgi:TonB family protein
MRLQHFRRYWWNPRSLCVLAVLIAASGLTASGQETLDLPGPNSAERRPASPSGDFDRVPPAPWGKGVVRAAHLLKLPTKVKHVSPRFPVEALQPGVRALVVVETRIEADGRIVHARVLRSSPPFDQSVLDAVLQWEYTPTVSNGVAIPVLLTVTVRFTGS